MRSKSIATSALLGTLLLPAAVCAQALEAPALAIVPDEELAASRGGETRYMQLNEVTESGQQNGNAAIGNITGGNWITEGAFTGATGFSTVIQNTGNNVLIQESLIVNLGYHQ